MSIDRKKEFLKLKDGMKAFFVMLAGATIAWTLAAPLIAVGFRYFKFWMNLLNP